MTKEDIRDIKVGQRLIDKRGRTWRVDHVYLALNNAKWVDLKYGRKKMAYNVTEWSFVNEYRVSKDSL